MQHPHAHDPISPELVLVDPELAARVRPVAVAGPSFQQPAGALHPPDAPAREDAAPRPSEPVSAPRAPAAIEPHAHLRRSHRLVSVLATLAMLGLLAAAFLPPRDAPRLMDPAAPATAAPRTPVTLAWRAVADADYYLVEVYRGNRLVHAQSVRKPQLGAPSWLGPGRYTWRVYAGQGRPAERLTRGPLESGWFLVTG